MWGLSSFLFLLSDRRSWIHWLILGKSTPLDPPRLSGVVRLACIRWPTWVQVRFHCMPSGGALHEHWEETCWRSEHWVHPQCTTRSDSCPAAFWHTHTSGLIYTSVHGSNDTLDKDSETYIKGLANRGESLFFFFFFFSLQILMMIWIIWLAINSRIPHYFSGILNDIFWHH